MRTRRSRRREETAASASQIVWLVAAVVVAAIPHLPYAQPWVPAMVAGLAAWRVLAALRRWRLPSLWVRIPLTILGFAAVLASYRQLSGINAGSALLLVMVAMKLLETRGHRDRAVVIFICYFLLFAAFLREQALWSLPYLLAAVLVATTALLQTARDGPAVQAAAGLRAAGRLLLQAVPLMLMLFVLFPRVPGPFWALPQDAGAGLSGLSDTMSPGDITQLALSDEVAFRVRFEDAIPPSAALYWRGPVLTRFDGRRWSMRPTDLTPVSRDAWPEPAATVGYELTLEPHRQRWLLALETVAEWEAPQSMLGGSFQLLSLAEVDRRLAYRATAALDGQTPGRMTEASKRTATSLPPDANPRTRALAAAMRAEATSDAGFLDATLRMFRDQPFRYRLDPAPLDRDSVDDFLFETREGFCGHYASAFATLARAAGIPARVVTGYQGGELNPIGNYWLVRQADAHAWAEVWLDGRWVRYDPTAAVAPERIELGMDAAISRGALLGAGGWRGNAFTDRLSMSWDAVNAAWDRWVLAYGPEAQAALLKLAGIANPRLAHLATAVAGCLAAFMLALWWLQTRRNRGTRDGLARAWARLCRRLAGVTRPRRPGETPSEYAAVAAALRPDLAKPVLALAETYVRLRYDGAATPGAVAQFAAAVRRFRPRPKPRPATSGSAQAGGSD